MGKNIEATLTGTIDVPSKIAFKLGLKNWSYEVSREETVYSFIVDQPNGLIRFPRNISKFKQACKDAGFTSIKFIDHRIESPLSSPIELDESFSLRDYQNKTVNRMLKKLKETTSVILKAPPSFGKSYIMPYIVKEVGEKTLILVDRTDLVSQMYGEFSKNISKGDYKVLEKTDKELADVNITTFQFLLKNPDVVEKLAKEIGLVVVDECHTISIGAFTKIVNNLPARLRIGLSATPTRSDGLTEALHDVMGNTVIEGENPDSLKVRYLILKQPVYFTYTLARTPVQAWNKFYSSPEVVEIATKLAIKMLRAGRAPLIYSTYKDAQETVQEFLKREGVSSAVINQKTKKKDREEILEKFQKREIDVLISGTITQKGVSIHRLDTIINMANHTKESMEQLVGRLRREHPDKKSPIFIDVHFEGYAIKKGMERFDYMFDIADRHSEEVIVWSQFKSSYFINGE